MNTQTALNMDDAFEEIRSIFETIRPLTTRDDTYVRTLKQGKLYELYVLSQLLEELKRRDFSILHEYESIHFKQAPGKIRDSDPHFIVKGNDGKCHKLVVNIEFQTLGYCRGANRSAPESKDLSSLHELDLVLVCSEASEYPTYKQVLLAVECKSNETLEKRFVREALGLRRELSLRKHSTRSRLSSLAGANAPPVFVPADPASEMWLAFIDSKGTRYAQSPDWFGIELKHLRPQPAASSSLELTDSPQSEPIRYRMGNPQR